MNDDGLPSGTALTAAAARAAHLLVDAEPVIFDDPFAAGLLGERAGELLAYHRAHGGHPVLAGARAAVLTRSRHTEERLARAVRAGTRQCLLLAAGLDSLALRAPFPHLRIFEADHPGTQDWKLRHLPDAIVGDTRHVPLDFESESLPEKLAETDFDSSLPVFVSWLGTVMYLTAEAVEETLAFCGSLAPGSELVLDYLLPEGLRDAAGQAYAEAVMPVAEQGGEPWRSFFSPERMTALLERHGLRPLAQLDQRDSIPARLWDRSDALRPSRLAMLAVARV